MTSSVEVSVEVSLSLVDAVVRSVFKVSNVKELYLPLPTKGFLTSFQARGSTFEISGKVEERNRAREVYQEAVEENKDAMIIEYFDTGIIYLKFHVVEDFVISLVSIAPLERIGDKLKLVLPIKTTRRYGYDAFRWSELPMKINAVESSHHFELFHGEQLLEGSSFPLSLLANEAITFSLTPRVSPIVAKRFENMVIIEGMVGPSGMTSKKRVLFVVDCSGSMFDNAGERIIGAKIAVETSLLNLNHEDEFNIMCFGSDYQFLFPNFVPFSDDSLAKARALLQDLPNLGGTKLFQAIAATLELPAHDILLLTDGDISNTPDLAKRFNLPRIHILGIGSDNNRTFIANLADVTKGTYELANKRNEIIIGVNRLMGRCSEKSSAVVSLNGDGTVIYPDYPIFLGAKCQEDEPIVLKLDGKEMEITPIEGDFETCQRYVSHILQSSSYLKVDVENGIDLAVRFKIVCHLTSLVGVSGTSRKTHLDHDVETLMVQNVDLVLQRGERLVAYQFKKSAVKLGRSSNEKSGGSICRCCLSCVFCWPCILYSEIRNSNYEPIREAPQSQVMKREEPPVVQTDDFDILNSILLKLNSDKKFVVDDELKNILRSLGMTDFTDEKIWELIQKRFPDQKIIYENLL
jgi:hypothetical protein